MQVVQTDLSSTITAWQKAIHGRDADRIASFFAGDVCAMYPNSQPTIGRDANRTAWAMVFQSPDAIHPISIEEVSVSEHGDMGYNTGK